jgi:hypothetical protein
MLSGVRAMQRLVQTTQVTGAQRIRGLLINLEHEIQHVTGLHAWSQREPGSLAARRAEVAIMLQHV